MRRHPGDASRQPRAGDEREVVEVHRARSAHAGGVGELDFGAGATDGRSDGTDDHRLQDSRHGIARQHDDRSTLVEIGEPDLAASGCRTTHRSSGPLEVPVGVVGEVAPLGRYQRECRFFGGRWGPEARRRIVAQSVPPDELRARDVDRGRCRGGAERGARFRELLPIDGDGGLLPRQIGNTAKCR